jgi:hypothetical protein
VHLVRSSTYKRESVTDGWAVEKGIGARPLGGWWLLLRWNSDATELNASFHDRPYEVPDADSDSDGNAKPRPVRSQPKPSKRRPAKGGGKAKRASRNRSAAARR